MSSMWIDCKAAGEVTARNVWRRSLLSLQT